MQIIYRWFKILIIVAGLWTATNLREYDTIFDRSVATQIFGPLGPGYFWANQTAWLVYFPFHKFYPGVKDQLLNKYAANSLYRVMKQLKRKKLLGEITQFRGCFNGRAIHGTNSASTHSYALACDFDSKVYSRKFVEIWERNGWTWGGTWCNMSKDTMHFSYAWEVKGKCSPYP